MVRFAGVNTNAIFGFAFENAMFSGNTLFGALTTGDFFAGTVTSASAVGKRWVYDTVGDRLLYDADGFATNLSVTTTVASFTSANATVTTNDIAFF